MTSERAKPRNDTTLTALSLGAYLKSIREDRELTLRDVEEATNKEVSNAYLSQIENQKIKKPSPNILNALAELYAIDFEGLMRRAGYLKSKRRTGVSDERHGRVATFAEHNLTASEEEELLDYLKFIRSRNRGSDET